MDEPPQCNKPQVVRLNVRKYHSRTHTADIRCLYGIFAWHRKVCSLPGSIPILIIGSRGE